MTPDGEWHRAVTLGAQGCYVESWSVLDARGRDDAPALTLRASHLRQIGEAEQAMAGDRSALRVAVDVEGRADARIGIAADFLCGGDPDAAYRELDAAEPDALAAGWRTATRLGWVRAECALARGDAASALLSADEAVRRSARHSPRHHAKSRIIRAVALMSSEQTASGLADLVAAAETLRAENLATLQWPAALIALDAFQRDLVPLVEAGVVEALGHLVDEGRTATVLIGEHLPHELAARWLLRPDVVRLAAGGESGHG